jgi:hypothetical protein
MNPFKQCGAKTRAGTPCKRPAMPNGRCRLHGGLTPIKHGRYSKANYRTLYRTLIELRLQTRLEHIFYAVRLLEPYLDNKTKEAIFEAAARYSEEDTRLVRPLSRYRKDT